MQNTLSALRKGRGLYVVIWQVRMQVAAVTSGQAGDQSMQIQKHLEGQLAHMVWRVCMPGLHDVCRQSAGRTTVP